MLHATRSYTPRNALIHSTQPSLRCQCRSRRQLSVNVKAPVSMTPHSTAGCGLMGGSLRWSGIPSPPCMSTPPPIVPQCASRVLGHRPLLYRRSIPHPGHCIPHASPPPPNVLMHNVNNPALLPALLFVIYGPMPKGLATFYLCHPPDMPPVLECLYPKSCQA